MDTLFSICLASESSLLRATPHRPPAFAHFAALECVEPDNSTVSAERQKLREDRIDILKISHSVAYGGNLKNIAETKKAAACLVIDEIEKNQTIDGWNDFEKA